MSQENIYTYEGMFLFPQSATANLQASVDLITSLIDRADGEIISLRKWDERRLAYDIQGNKRGVYFLTYFKAAATKMVELERACNLSEELLRSMFIRADEIPADQMEAAEGRTELADEIKLRSEQAEQRGPDNATSSVTKRTEPTEQPAASEAPAPAPVAKPEPVVSGADAE